MGRTFREKAQAAFKVHRVGGDWLYVHAGATPGLVHAFHSVTSLNLHAKAIFDRENVELEDYEDIILESHAKDDSPFWNRICYTDEDHWDKTDADRCADVQVALDMYGAKRMVIGHCPARYEKDEGGEVGVYQTGWGAVEFKCRGSFLNADTFMSQGYTEGTCETPNWNRRRRCPDHATSARAAERSRHNEAVIEYYDGDGSGLVWVNYPRRNPPECWVHPNVGAAIVV